jgi:hypothetical protein
LPKIDREPLSDESFRFGVEVMSKVMIAKGHSRAFLHERLNPGRVCMAEARCLALILAPFEAIRCRYLSFRSETGTPEAFRMHCTESGIRSFDRIGDARSAPEPPLLEIHAGFQPDSSPSPPRSEASPANYVCAYSRDIVDDGRLRNDR